MEEQEKIEVVEQITDYVNKFSSNPKEFVKQMSMEHRTLQQSFTRLVFQWLEHCASPDYRYDGRNEATHQISKEVIDAFSKFKEEQLPAHWRGVKPSEFLPLI